MACNIPTPKLSRILCVCVFGFKTSVARTLITATIQAVDWQHQRQQQHIVKIILIHGVCDEKNVQVRNTQFAGEVASKMHI